MMCVCVRERKKDRLGERAEDKVREKSEREEGETSLNIHHILVIMATFFQTAAVSTLTGHLSSLCPPRPGKKS